MFWEEPVTGGGLGEVSREKEEIIEKAYQKYQERGGRLPISTYRNLQNILREKEGVLAISPNTIGQAQQMAEEARVDVTPEVLSIYSILRENTRNVLEIREGVDLEGHPTTWSDQPLLAEALLISGDIGSHDKFLAFCESKPGTSRLGENERINKLRTQWEQERE